jgi:hypothetical protein
LLDGISRLLTGAASEPFESMSNVRAKLTPTKPLKASLTRKFALPSTESLLNCEPLPELSKTLPYVPNGGMTLGRSGSR